MTYDRHKKTLENQGFIRVIKSITYDLPYKPTSSTANAFILRIICACALDRPHCGWESKHVLVIAGLHIILHRMYYIYTTYTKKLEVFLIILSKAHPSRALVTSALSSRTMGESFHQRMYF